MQAPAHRMQEAQGGAEPLAAEEQHFRPMKMGEPPVALDEPSRFCARGA